MSNSIYSSFKWLFKRLFSIWEKLPDSVKKQIIESVVNEFTELFRKYYRRWRRGKDI